MTPDENFLLGPHPQHANVTIAAGFSGHGFKFAQVIGEILADIVLGQTPKFNLDLFSIERFHVSRCPVATRNGQGSVDNQKCHQVNYESFCNTIF